MLGFIAARFGQMIVVLFGVSVVAFVLPRLGGSPAALLLSPTATPDDLARFNQAWGLNDPWPVQYLRFALNALTGNFGKSLVYQAPVTTLIGQRLPVTLTVSGLALIVVFSGGLGLGVLSGIFRGRLPDTVVRGVAFLFQAIPAFLLGIALIFLFAVGLRWLPITGATGTAQSLVLPVLTLAAYPLTSLLRLTRKEVIEVSSSDYIDFARMKGLSERRVIWVHVLRNSLIGPLTYAGFLTASLLTGTVVVEYVFAMGGIGSLAVRSVESLDYPIIQALLLLFALIYVVANFVVDVAYGFVDPRLRRHKRPSGAGR